MIWWWRQRCNDSASRLVLHGGTLALKGVLLLAATFCQKRLTLLAEVVFFFFLGGGGLYLGGPLQHTGNIPSWQLQRMRLRCVYLKPREGSRCSESDTYSPLSLLFRRLRYIAMAVPITASSTMAPIIPPMMLPVVGPFSGRRVPAGTQKQGKQWGRFASALNTAAHINAREAHRRWNARLVFQMWKRNVSKKRRSRQIDYTSHLTDEGAESSSYPWFTISTFEREAN